MLELFKSFVTNEKLFSPKEKILLTISGGIDSMVLCELFHLAGFKFGIAHCNFQLRGMDSDQDELFVASMAKKYKADFHSIKFDTSSFAKKNKLSTQIAARKLRYKWFEELREKYNYNFIATGHHINDSIETILINLIRGTGLSGFHGILPKQEKLVRPLLFATKTEIISFGKKHKIKFREDLSNSSDKYVRNKIRHQVIPILKEINPSLEKTIDANSKHIRDVELIVNREIEKQKAKAIIIDPKNLSGEIKFSIAQLKKLSPLTLYLFEFLKPYNFNAATVVEIIASLDKESGKQFYSETHILIKDRSYLCIEEIEAKTPLLDFNIKKNQQFLNSDELQLKFEIISATAFQKCPKKIAQVDFDTLSFPLNIRKWEKGDSFSPLGMKGQKKLSDFFIDQKLSILQKNNVWLLTSNHKIVWIIGHRVDDRFKVTGKTKNIFQITLI